MPYIRVQTNQTAADSNSLLSKLSAVAAKAIGKPESYVQTALDDGRPMTFGGSDAPTVFIECKSIGLTETQTTGISATLSRFCTDELSVPDNRIYIEFTGASGKMWGWQSGTF